MRSLKSSHFLLVIGAIIGCWCWLYVIGKAVEHNATVPDKHQVVVEVEKVVVSPPRPDVDANDVHCLALNIWHEARGTSPSDRLAVGHVTKNRADHPKYPEEICDVVFQGVHAKDGRGEAYPLRFKCQFSWYCDGRSDTIKLTDRKGAVIHLNVQLWEQIQTMSFDILAGFTTDPTNGATHYLNPRVLVRTPRWTREFALVHQTDGHKFYRM